MIYIADFYMKKTKYFRFLIANIYWYRILSQYIENETCQQTSERFNKSKQFEKWKCLVHKNEFWANIHPTLFFIFIFFLYKFLGWNNYHMKANII